MLAPLNSKFPPHFILKKQEALSVPFSSSDSAFTSTNHPRKAVDGSIFRALLEKQAGVNLNPNMKGCQH